MECNGYTQRTLLDGRRKKNCVISTLKLLFGISTLDDTNTHPENNNKILPKNNIFMSHVVIVLKYKRTISNS